MTMHKQPSALKVTAFLLAVIGLMIHDLSLLFPAHRTTEFWTRSRAQTTYVWRNRELTGEGDASVQSRQEEDKVEGSSPCIPWSNNQTDPTTEFRPGQHYCQDLDNQEYTWYGNQWVPPPGIPMYNRHDMLRAFSQFDTLWIGDSTARRAYGTIFALLNASNASLTVEELDHPRVLDVNKYDRKGYHENSCTAQREHSQQFLTSDKDNLYGPRSICRRVGGKRAFDFTRIECLYSLEKLVNQPWVLERYSLIIIGMGAFEFLQRYCGSSPLRGQKLNPATQYRQLEKHAEYGFQSAKQMADIMQQAQMGNLNYTTNSTTTTSAATTATGDDHQNKSSRPTAVIWRTTGFDSSNDTHVATFATPGVLHLNQLAKDFIQQNRQQEAMNDTSSSSSNLVMVDWGTAVYPRSFTPHKVEADITAHYGLEARLLMAQMTTQQLFNILGHHYSSNHPRKVETTTTAKQ